MRTDQLMTDLSPGVRNSVRAIIARDDAILVQHKVSPDGRVRLTLPGGAPDPGETLQAGLQRECLEEIGVSVEVVELVHVADFYKPRDTDPPSKRQQVEFFFRCTTPDGYEAKNGPKPDKHQVDVIWLPFGKMKDSPLFPSSLKVILAPGYRHSPVYLGLID